MRELVRRAGKNMQTKFPDDERFQVHEAEPDVQAYVDLSAGYRAEEAFIVKPAPNQEAEVAFQVLVGTMHAVAKIQGKHAFDMEVYEAAYAGICPIFPIC